MNWQPAETAPKDGTWILVRIDHVPFTVRWMTPFAIAPHLADWRDEHGKVREFQEWKMIE